RLVVLHRRRRPELQGHLQPAEHPVLAAVGERQGQVSPPDPAGRGPMSWVRRHRIRRYLASSLWIMPLAGILLALVAAPLVRGLDAATRWTLLGFTPEGARTALGAGRVDARVHRVRLLDDPPRRGPCVTAGLRVYSWPS